MTIIDQRRGRFERGRPVGPVTWPHHDLLWIHDGAVDLDAGGGRRRLDPETGALIPPGMTFRLSVPAPERSCRASILHARLPDGPEGLRVNRADDTPLIRTLIEAGLDDAARDWDGSAPRREAILALLLHSFHPPPEADSVHGRGTDRLDAAWRSAGADLSRIRSLADVAGLAGLSESRLRALQAARPGGTAGARLRSMRLERAASLLRTTRMPVAAIALEVGYASPEALSTAFRRAHGLPPRTFRQRVAPFA